MTERDQTPNSGDETLHEHHEHGAKGIRLGYVPALDGVRAIAALGVMLAHYLSEIAGSHYWLSFRGGGLGIYVFFTLSGFLITTLLVEEHQRWGSINLRNFWARRALRLIPALLAVVAALVVIAALVDAKAYPYGQGLGAAPAWTSDWQLLPFWPGIVVVLLPISNWVWAVGDAIFNPLVVGWTLAIEDQFYFVWPFILALLLMRRQVSLRTCAIVIAAAIVAFTIWRHVLVVSDAPKLEVRTDFHVAEILIGCGLGLALAAGIVPSRPRTRQVLGVLAWASALGILVLFVVDAHQYLEPLLTLLALMTAVVIIHLVIDRTSRLSMALSWAPLVGIGQVSYGLYLWHWVWLQYPLTLHPVKIPIAVALTSVTVLASYYLIERPALNLKSRFAAGQTPGASSDPRHTPRRYSRRNLLPLLGMGSITVAAVAAYGLSSRFYPRPAEAFAAPTPTSVPTSTPIPSPTPTPMPTPTPSPVPTWTPGPRPTRVPKPTRVPRLDRQERQATQSRNGTGDFTAPGTPEPAGT
jgi:peptidoglycan/LPS O-acetylase OafA/YrhL